MRLTSSSVDVSLLSAVPDEGEAGTDITLSAPATADGGALTFSRWVVTEGDGTINGNVLTLGLTDCVVDAVYEDTVYNASVTSHARLLDTEDAEDYIGIFEQLGIYPSTAALAALMGSTGSVSPVSGTSSDDVTLTVPLYVSLPSERLMYNYNDGSTSYEVEVDESVILSTAPSGRTGNRTLQSSDFTVDVDNMEASLTEKFSGDNNYGVDYLIPWRLIVGGDNRDHNFVGGSGSTIQYGGANPEVGTGGIDEVTGTPFYSSVKGSGISYVDLVDDPHDPQFTWGTNVHIYVDAFDVNRDVKKVDVSQLVLQSLGGTSWRFTPVASFQDLIDFITNNYGSGLKPLPQQRYFVSSQ